MTIQSGNLEQIKFRPRARLVETIGGDLIKDEMAGVIELVKNAYDADATEVTIAFSEIRNSKKATIIIDDNGHGMSRKILLDDWMSPATADKGERKTSPRGRPMLGRKGIGRFSAMRLGDVLILETKPGRNAPELKQGEAKNWYRLNVNWNDFRDPDKYLEEVELDLELFEDAKVSDHWTRLLIQELKDTWNVNRLRRLLRELRLLLSPIELKEKTDFTIHLDLSGSGFTKEETKGFPEKVEPYSTPDVADYVVNAEIDKDGSYSIKYTRHLYSDIDEEEMSVEETENDVRKLYEFDDHDIPLPLPCGPLSIRLIIWDRDPSILQTKADRIRDLELMGLRAVRRYLDDISGIAIYRDGFRVRPYGDKDQDWVGLAQRRVQKPVQSIGPNQLFGLVNISSMSNPGLEDKSSREGLKENLAYEALYQSVLGALSWSEPFRYRFRKNHNLGRPAPKSTKALVQERQKIFESLSSRITQTIEDEKKREQFARLITRAQASADREHEHLAKQAQIMHDMHALGLLARFVIHEGRTLDSSLDSALNNVERVSKNARISEPERMVVEGESLEIFDSSLFASRGAQEKLDELLDQLDPLTRPRPKRRSNIEVEKTIKNAISILAPSFNEAHIEVVLTKRIHKVKAREADLFHSIYNLLHNSLFWVQQGSGPRKINIRVRNVKATEVDKKPGIEIRVTDTGPGVSINAAPHIFDLGYTEKRGGYGVGLFIAKEAVERSEGTIELINPGEKGADFRLLLKGV